jgi:putative addiction module component (TIGR02574 family)
MAELLKDILKLSVSDRMLLVEAIWDSISSENNDFSLAEARVKMLDDRLKSHLNDPSQTTTWNQIKASLPG